MKKNILSRLIVYIFSLITPISIFSFILLFLVKIYPIGDTTILKVDFTHQYIHFYKYLYDAILGNESLLYNWYAGLGSNHIGNVGYYTSSPFLFILFLFHPVYLTEAAAMLVLMKVGLCGLTMSILIRNKFPGIGSLEVVIFSTFYALMSYVSVFYHNVMWLDALIWLPILIIATDTLIRKGKVILITIFLALLFISNFYMAYMIGLFVFIYFVSEMIVRWNKINHFDKYKASIKFALGTLIAAGISSFLLLPTYLQLSKADTTQPNEISGINTEVLPIFHKMFSGVYDSVMNGSPFVYIGTFVFILVPLFFVNKSIDRAEKIRWGSILVFLYLSMLIPVLDYMWHGFALPNSFLYRQAFLFSFVMLLISLKAYEQLNSSRTRSIMITYLCSVLLIIISFTYIEDSKTLLFLNLVTVTMVCLFFIIKIHGEHGKWKVLSLTLIILYAISELSFNTGSFYYHLSMEVGNASKGAYYDYQKYGVVNHKIKELDSTHFYRIDHDLELTSNDSIYLRNSSLSYFSSMLDNRLSKTLKSFGLSERKANYTKNGATPFIESLLGVKYMISTEEVSRLGYEEMEQFNDFHVSKNRYALPLGVVMEERLTDFSVSEFSNPFDLQNQLLNHIIGNEESLYKPVLITQKEYSNAEVTEDESITLKRIDSDYKMRIKYRLQVEEASHVYMQLLSELSGKKDIQVRVNQLHIADYLSKIHNGILDLGMYEDTNLLIEVVLDRDEAEIKEERFYIAKMEEYKTMMDSLIHSVNQESFWIENLSGNELVAKAIVEDENQILFLSIPWDEGWNVVIDGKRVTPVKVLDAFIGIPLSKGEHDIHLTFIPYGFQTGMIISFISVFILGLIWFFEYRSMYSKGSTIRAEKNIHYKR